MDNLLAGAETIEEAHLIRDEITQLLELGGFPLRQWASNDKRILENLSETQIDKHFLTDDDHTVKTLGLSWNAEADNIKYTVNFTNTSKARTKRTILSEIARIFDPLGLLGPIILYARNIMQELWKENLH